MSSDLVPLKLKRLVSTIQAIKTQEVLNVSKLDEMQAYVSHRLLFCKTITLFMLSDGLNRPGGGVLGSGFAGHVLLASQNPHPIIVYSVANYRPHLSHFWANVIVISRTEFNAS